VWRLSSLSSFILKQSLETRKRRDLRARNQYEYEGRDMTKRWQKIVSKRKDSRWKLGYGGKGFKG